MLPNFTALLLAILAASTPALALWPMPTQLTTGKTPIRLAPDFSINIALDDAPQDLKDAVSRSMHYIQTDKLERLVLGRGSVDNDVAQRAKPLSALTLSITNGSVHDITQEAILPLEKRNEAYELTVPGDGSPATLTAATSLGLFRGLTTFEQLWYESSGVTYALEAPYHIVDKPAFLYRGLMLDTARNYFPIKDIKRTLDAMSWVKINTLHWHVVDSQSFPLVVPGLQEISDKGAYSPSMVYTASDVKDIVSYAAARGIDVIVEIDTPGHTAVIAKAHPEYVACPEASPWTKYANEPPAGQLRFASEATTKFTASLLTSVASLFTSPYLSTGGDELNENCYAQDDQTQADLKAQGKTLEQALGAFTDATHDALRKVGKTPVVWEEMAIGHPGVQLGKDALVLVWISSQNAASVAAKGNRLIHAPSDYFYLDCGAGTWLGNFTAGKSWCDPFKTWQKAYSFDPYATLSPEQHSLVMGGQQLLWSEQAGPENLDSIVWPRAGASAEVFWSGPGGDVKSALPRLHDLSFRMRARGVGAISLQPLWCALRPGACDLVV